MPRYRSLDEVLGEPDELGLLNVRAGNRAISVNDRVLQGFESINAFVDQHRREPSGEGEMEERRLERRLAHIRSTSALRDALVEQDRHGLLAAPSSSATQGATQTSATSLGEGVASLDDIWDDDDLGLLDPGDESILENRNLGDRTPSATPPDGIAQRRPCDDFWRFEPLFERIRRRMESGEAETRRFQYENKIEVGDYFIVYGLLCLVDDVLDTRKEVDPSNPRLRVVFDNGTETNLLKLSLGKALYADKNGRRVLDPDLESDRMAGLSHHDRRSGTIYILRSRSRHPALHEYRDLVKIGYTEGEVEDRTRYAEHDPAFLEGPVEVVESFACYNLNPRKFEGLVHAFLADRRLRIQLQGKRGQIIRPREWFAVPPATAIQVVENIVNGTITQYRLDAVSGRVVKKG